MSAGSKDSGTSMLLSRPLKWFTRCAACGTPITGGMSAGRNKKFGYYRCRKQYCRLVNVRREALEESFVAHLNRFKPDPQTVADFPRIAELAWTNRQGNAEAKMKKLDSELLSLKNQKSELLRAKLRGEVSQPDYAQGNAELEREKNVLEEQLQAGRSQRLTLHAFQRFAKAMLLNLGEAWRRAEVEQKVWVQNFLFEGGLNYSQESGDFEHPNPCLFNAMEGFAGGNSWLASPTGFEPVLPP
jgi:hypothetical protein